MKKNQNGTTEQLEYLQRFHRKKTALEMATALSISEVKVYMLCIEINVVPLSRCREANSVKKKVRGKASGKPVQKKRIYIKNPGPPKKNIQRPPAVYTNILSPFGLADQLHGLNLKFKNNEQSDY